jgi:hypothetical protein
MPQPRHLHTESITINLTPPEGLRQDGTQYNLEPPSVTCNSKNSIHHDSQIYPEAHKIQPAAATLHRNEVQRLYTEPSLSFVCLSSWDTTDLGLWIPESGISRGGKLMDNRMDMTTVTSAHTWLLPGAAPNGATGSKEREF